MNHISYVKTADSLQVITCKGKTYWFQNALKWFDNYTRIKSLSHLFSPCFVLNCYRWIQTKTLKHRTHFFCLFIVWRHLEIILNIRNLIPILLRKLIYLWNIYICNSIMDMFFIDTTNHLSIPSSFMILKVISSQCDWYMTMFYWYKSIKVIQQIIWWVSFGLFMFMLILVQFKSGNMMTVFVTLSVLHPLIMSGW